MSAERPIPAITLVDSIGIPSTKKFKAACQRAARKRGMSLAGYARLALSDRMAADGVRHPQDRKSNGTGKR